MATLDNIRKTAERQNTAQPAISNRIATLENEPGIQLFELDSDHSMLKAKGQKLLPYAEKILLSSQQLRNHADGVALLSGYPATNGESRPVQLPADLISFFIISSPWGRLALERLQQS